MPPSNHPELSDLLLWQSGELSAQENAIIQDHLTQCNVCHDRLAEIEVIYKSVAFVDEKVAQYKILNAIKKKKYWLRLHPVPRWIGATAAALIVALLVSPIANITQSARAESILSKASAAETIKSNSQRFLSLSIHGQQCDMAVKAAGESRQLVQVRQNDSCSQISADFQSVGWNWDDLLSARSFQQWRHSLKKKTDSIQEHSDFTEVSTEASEGLLRKASLRIRNFDHRPVEERFVFCNSTSSSLNEIVVKENPIAPVEVANNRDIPLQAVAHPAEAVPAIEPLDLRELAVRLALHKIGADENILLGIKRSEGTIKIVGIVPTPELKSQIYALSDSPSVSVLVSTEDEPQMPGGNSGWRSFHGDETPLANDSINALFPGDPQGRQQFVNELDSLSLKLVGQAAARDGLLAMARRAPGTDEAKSAAVAANDIQIHMRVCMSSLAARLQPLIGNARVDSKGLNYVGAMQIYQLVHELVQLKRSNNLLTAAEAELKIRNVFSR